MKQLTIEDAKQIELEILDYIDTLCKKHNINYIINYGTLIGAVRHQGFIPWDDDIDLSMPQEDYQRFINIFQKEKSKYKLLSLETDKNYFNNFIKITDSTTKIIDTRNTKTYESGVFLDIFPMDCFDDPKVIDTCYKLESFKLLSFSKHKNIVYKEIQKYSRENGQYMAFIPSKFKEKEVFPSGTFKELILTEFEGRMLPVPKKYDQFLTQMYGDYMTSPSKEMQEWYSHSIKAYHKSWLRTTI